MRRAVATILGTAAGTALLVGAKLGGPPHVAPPVTAPSPTGSSPVPSPSPSLAPSLPAASPSPSRSVAPTRPAPKPSPTPALRDGTFIGVSEDERYGTVTVTVTVSSGRLTDVLARCGGCRGMSGRISSNAFPTLREEALTAQSAHINTVSGATYTSQAYVTSLQSALDQAGS